MNIINSKEETEKVGLKLNIQEIKIMTSGPITSWQINGKTIPLTRWTFADKVMSLLYNILCKLIISFHPRSKRLLISWLKSPSTVTLKPKNIKSVSNVSPFICHEVMGPDVMILIS